MEWTVGWVRSSREAQSWEPWQNREIVTWTNDEVKLIRHDSYTDIVVQGKRLDDISSKPYYIIRFLADELFDRLEVSRLEQLPIRNRQGEVIKDE